MRRAIHPLPKERYPSAALAEEALHAGTKSLVDAQSAAGVAVANIHASMLLANPNAMLTSKDISNPKSAARHQLLSTQTLLEALFKLFEEHRFWYEVDQHTSRLKYLLWTHQATVAYLRHYPDVLVLDCTYKTNKFNLPLLNIVSVTGMNTVLPVAQCRLPGEAAADFEWALSTLRQLLSIHNVRLPRVILTDRDLACMNALAMVFPSVPSMVCRWHMDRNALARTRQVLGQVRVDNPGPFEPKYRNTWQTDAFMAKFHSAVASKTEHEFEQARLELHVYPFRGSIHSLM